MTMSGRYVLCTVFLSRLHRCMIQNCLFPRASLFDCYLTTQYSNTFASSAKTRYILNHGIYSVTLCIDPVSGPRAYLRGRLTLSDPGPAESASSDLGLTRGALEDEEEEEEDEGTELGAMWLLHHASMSSEL
jgi:hypothetical protein